MQPVDQLPKCGAAEFGCARVCWHAIGLESQVQCAALSGRQHVIGRFAVDDTKDIAAARAQVESRLRTNAVGLLANDAEPSDVGLSGSEHRADRGELRDDLPLGVAGAAAVQQVALQPWLDVGRHRVEVRAEQDRWFVAPTREHVAATGRNALQFDVSAEFAQYSVQRGESAVLVPRGGVVGTQRLETVEHPASQTVCHGNWFRRAW